MSYSQIYEVEVEVEVDLHYLQRESARRLVIEKIQESHSRNISCIKFITGRGNHMNSTGERGVLFETFPSWLSDIEVSNLIQNYVQYVGYYLVYLDLSYTPRTHHYNHYEPKTSFLSELFEYFRRVMMWISIISIFILIIFLVFILLYSYSYYYYKH
ncbi:hypothetical protein C1645_422299 [Glomus cerebriforme]|uniref:Smr domain-containing protein n=1 Tax=Glomus cerebriforme TaxID=658196 RepID=A0A397SE93_9GLOM|nr:hypothetical protein C1645_422299 [Glomus cerebriforme]